MKFIRYTQPYNNYILNICQFSQPKSQQNTKSLNTTTWNIGSNNDKQVQIRKCNTNTLLNTIFQNPGRDSTSKTQSINPWDNQNSLQSKLQDFDMSLFNK